MKIRFVLISIITTFFLCSISIKADDKLTAEEIVAKHLESIGTKEKRASIKNLVILCSLQFRIKGGANFVSGNSVFASDGDKNLLGMQINSNDYPKDSFSFDGEKTRVAFTKPGSYSVLGDFVFNNRELLREGLVGGTLFSSWALNDVEKRKLKVSGGGIKKIGSQDVYSIGITPKSSIDLEIRMFFDKKTFRHVRTEYTKFIAAVQASTIDASAGQSSNRIQVVEEFSDYQNMDGLMLPGSYSITHSRYNNSAVQSARNSNQELNWKFRVTNFSFNQQLDPNSFAIATN